MTINIIKEFGTISDIKFKGLGDPGPFSFSIVDGTLPDGTTFNPTTLELTGTFTKTGTFTFTIQGKKKDRIENTEEFSIKISDKISDILILSKIDFKNDVDYNGQVWNKTGTVTKITNDVDLFDSECYELKPGGMTLTMPEIIGSRDFEIDIIIKPLEGSANYGRILLIGPNSVSGTFLINREASTSNISLHYCPNGTNTWVRILYNVNEVFNYNQWNRILVIRKNTSLTLFLNDRKIITEFFSNELTSPQLFIGANNVNTENFNCRIKHLSIKINKNKHYLDPDFITDVFRYKIVLSNELLLNSFSPINELIKSTFTGPYTIRVKNGYSLPSGLQIINNCIIGNSLLNDNLETVLELMIDDILHDEINIVISDKQQTINILELPLTGIVNSTVFGDTLSRQWNKINTIKIVNDTDVLTDGTSTFFDKSGNLNLKDDTFKLNFYDCEYSFWFKIDHSENNISSNKYLLLHGFNNVNGLLLFFIHPDNSRLTISTYTNGWFNILSTPSSKSFLKNEYNYIHLIRKNNNWKLYLNYILVSEIYYEYSLTSDTIFIGSNSTNGEKFKGNIFNLKINKNNISDQILPNPTQIVKWNFYLKDLFFITNNYINEQIKSNWYYSPVTYLINENSALPLGIILHNNGVIEGSSSLLFDNSVLIDCYIDNVLNRTISIKIKITTIEIAKSIFLTHSIKTLKDSIEIINEKGTNTVVVSNVNVVTVTNIGAMINFELGSPRDPYKSYISIPNKEFDAIKKSFCFEALFYLSNKDNIFGFQRLVKEFSNVLFSKSNTYSYETSVGLNNINDLLALFFYSGVSYTNPVSYNKNTNLTLSTLHHVAVTYDLTFLRFFIDGIQVSKIPWNGFQGSESNPLYIGGVPHTSYAGHSAGFNGYLNDIKLYQNNPIYIENFTPDLNYKLSPDFPIIEPNIFYTGKINGITNQTVSISEGVLPAGLVINNKGVISGITVAEGSYPITLTVIDDLIIEHFDIVLSLANLVLDLDFSLPIVNGKIKDKLGNEFTVIGNPTIQTNSNFSSNKSLYLNGTDSWLKLPADKVFKLNTLDFVIEFELILNSDVKINGGNYPGIISQRNDSLTDHAFSIELCGGSTSGDTLAPESVKNAVGLMISNSGSIVSGSSKSCYGIGLLKDTKYKIKFIKKDGNIKLFVNDVFTEAVKIANVFTIWNSNQDLLIGCLNSAYSANRLFHGHIGYMKIYTGTVYENGYNNTGYIYYRLEFLESAGSSNWIELQEIELATSIGGGDITNSGTLVTASSWYSSGGEQMHPSGLIDNNLINPDTNAWSQASNTLPAWVEFQLETPKDIKELRILTRNKAGYESRGPKSFKVTGSNDGFVYNEIATFSNVINWNSNWKAFNLLEGTYRTP